MSPKLAILSFVAIAIPTMGVQMAASPNRANQVSTDSGGPRVTCEITTNTTNWRPDDAKVEVSVSIQLQGTEAVSGVPSLNLYALPEKALGSSNYWAPFNVETGSSARGKQTITGREGPRALRLGPTRLFWAPSISSVWPHQSFAAIAVPGRYRLEAQIELSKGIIAKSNGIEITILK